MQGLTADASRRVFLHHQTCRGGSPGGGRCCRSAPPFHTRGSQERRLSTSKTDGRTLS
jgi:hypothetical protein